MRTESGALAAITWIGSGQVLITQGSLRAPVIIRAGALARNVPAHDLCVTRDHAIRVGRVLIAAEHLVNGASVVWDDRARVLEYFHIELAAHAILLANGAPAESFRASGVATPFPNSATQPRGAAAPCRRLVTSGRALEQAWARVAARAGIVSDLTTEADIHLEADGVRIDPVAAGGGVLRFRLSAVPVVLNLVSRSVIPAAAELGADLRRLGCAVADIVLTQAGRRTCLNASGPALTRGFHAPEDGYRWTTGHAAIPAASLRAGDGEVTVEIAIVGTAPCYRLMRPAARRPAARSARQTAGAPRSSRSASAARKRL